MANKRLKKKRGGGSDNCPLCGKALPREPEQMVVGRTGRAVCLECLELAQKIGQISCRQPESRREAVVTPDEMLARLDRIIIGQGQAKRAVTLALWKQQLRSQGVALPNSGLLLYGPTGCGKTALVREAAKIAGLPFLCCDATNLTEAGYRGGDARDMIVDLVERYGPERSRYGVIFLDEIDKQAAQRGNEHRASYQRGTQHSLLKLVEGTTVRAEGEDFSTEHLLFLFGGAFSGLWKERREQTKRREIGFLSVASVGSCKGMEMEDFVRYGMEPELMGRIGRCVELEELNGEMLRRILLESELSVFRRYEEYFRMRGCPLTLTEEETEKLVVKALERGVGARGLNALVEEWIEPKLLALAGGERDGWNCLH